MKISLPLLLFASGLWIGAGALAAQMPAGPAQGPAPQSAPAQAPPSAADSDTTPQAAQKNYIVPSGTRLPLILHNAVTTKNAKAGDPVYLETLFPVVIDNRILIPAGSYVQGEILEARRPGKVKGTGEIRLRLNSMILPNGYAVDFNAI